MKRKMRVATLSEEAIERLRAEGNRVQRCRFGGFSVSPPQQRARRTRPIAEGPTFLQEVNALWAEVDMAGADAWRAYAAAVHRRGGYRGRVLSSYQMFMKTVAAAMAKAPGERPSLVPPVLPESKRKARLRKGQGPTYTDGAGI